MARFHLVGNGASDIGEGKQAAFLCHAGMEHDLQQQIAKLLTQLVHRTALYRIDNLVGFFDGIRRDAPEILRQIPFASLLWITQTGHDFQETIELV